VKQTVEIKRIESIAILDSTSKIRNRFLDKWFLNGIDAIRFYSLAGKFARIPILGLPMKKTLELYYRYLHTNSLVFPLKDIEEIINSATHLYVDPCPCRLLAGDKACDAPLFVCLRINNSARIRKGQMGSKGLSREDAISIMRNARKHGLVFSLESCIQPYQYNICSCCNDCCIAMRMRYDYKLDVYNSGPYVPEITTNPCSACGVCVEKCPVHAMSITNDLPAVNLDDCLGCGICSEACPQDSIQMVISRDRIRKDSEPGRLRMILSLIYVYASMIPLVMFYRFFAGSMRQRSKEAQPNANDVLKREMQ
jgi:NAD-dependent dihydropyrimidine dehydrogenase PreA subunit